MVFGRSSRDNVVLILALIVSFGAISYVIFGVDDALLGDPLGGLVPFKAGFDKREYGQTVGQLVSSITDPDMNIILGLFVATSFALSRDRNHQRHHLYVKMVPLCIFASSSVLAVFFAIKLKSWLLLQIQFDKVDVELLRSALTWHLFFLLFSALSCFSIILMSLGRAPDTRKFVRD